MENAVDSLCEHCIGGITANAERTRDMVLNSLGIAQAPQRADGMKCSRSRTWSIRNWSR